jgi:UDP-N-acetylglucosamine--N-acetylmuramyl-(pentapeptide) pyrophosphoryl-undecaprenol N-acetylglucosamine transferase
MRQNVLPLLENPDRLAAMGHAAAGFGVLDADQRLADLVRAAAASR